MFNLTDRSFEQKPKMMAVQTALAAIHQYAAELQRCGIMKGVVILHGGEPTLWPQSSFDILFKAIGKLRDAGLEIDVGLQTNLLKPLDDGLVRLLTDYSIRLGVSLDGPSEINDHYRTDHAGKGSYNRVVENVSRLIDSGHSEILNGFLCVMQPSIPPSDFVSWALTLPIPSINLLWPMEYTVEHPPWFSTTELAYARSPIIGSWLRDVFFEWLRHDDPHLKITLFREVVEACLGHLRSNDLLGRRAFNSIVVETDGYFSLPDYLRAASNGCLSLEQSVFTGGLVQALQHPRLIAEQNAMFRYPTACRKCEHVSFCAGGALSGRIDAFGNVVEAPSVLCYDHKLFFDAVNQTVRAALSCVSSSNYDGFSV